MPEFLLFRRWDSCRGQRARLLTFLVALCVPTISFGQGATPPESSGRYQPPIAHVFAVDREVTLIRDNEASLLQTNDIIVDSDIVQTDRGWALLVLPGAATVAVDEYSTLEAATPTLLALTEGHIAIKVDRDGPRQGYRIDAGNSMVRLHASGDYRLTLAGPDGRDLRVAALRGQAEIETSGRRLLVAAGYEAHISADGSAAGVVAVPVTSWTPLDRWAEAHEPPTGGSRYLPAPLRAYAGVLDADGSWEADRTYGYVWYPRVASDWQPYSAGRWASIHNYGWTWVGDGRWAWPTHHYGRWRHSGTRWYWVPGVEWAPAWVSWISAPGYVAWCPVGVPIGLSVGIGRTWPALPLESFRTRTILVRGNAVPIGRLSDRVTFGSPPPRLARPSGPTAVARRRAADSRPAQVGSRSPARALPDSRATRSTAPSTARPRIDSSPSRSVAPPVAPQRGDAARVAPGATRTPQPVTGPPNSPAATRSSRQPVRTSPELSRPPAAIPRSSSGTPPRRDAGEVREGPTGSRRPAEVAPRQSGQSRSTPRVAERPQREPQARTNAPADQRRSSPPRTSGAGGREGGGGSRAQGRASSGSTGTARGR